MGKWRISHSVGVSTHISPSNSSRPLSYTHLNLSYVHLFHCIYLSSYSTGNTSQSATMPVPNLTNFNDPLLFPTFTTCPDVDTNPNNVNSSHWFLLGQVKENMTITKPTLILADRLGSPFALVFDGLERDDLDFKSLGLKKGATVVIPNAIRTLPKEEGKRGFVSVPKGQAGEVKAIPGSLEKVLLVGEWMRVNGGIKNEGGKEICDSCGKPADETNEKSGNGKVGLLKCTGCGGVRYCNKDCQVEAWNNWHKGDCKVIKGINAIFA
ncbi:hypothetical protein QBC46DRAFT_380520 [Diplogelasinospora grovesii]|uniref:MYND-type domain-containing protein n=1 Tax=Diplogelasinospora grovesii TaxID=303347 RepID=A0AAN6S6J2_9PEZI|nr:hypothetical protein QBC46DRAFT_380520 [Diplogelasinospora grovesii]